jgi:hypothetical protein
LALCVWKRAGGGNAWGLKTGTVVTFGRGNCVTAFQLLLLSERVGRRLACSVRGPTVTNLRTFIVFASQVCKVVCCSSRAWLLFKYSTFPINALLSMSVH